ncbi:MAG: CHC2 zinc finger domain-containing protein [Anaerolineales bacterium]|nr:CHC2 zinc finger domain-containing protein [Anaerolineales bacterium]
MIPQSEIDRLNALDIAGVIAHDLGPALRERNGHVYFRCPFHDDHDPSLDVHRAKNTAFCNPCGRSWKPIKWVMDYERVDFREACRRLGAADLPAVTVADLPKLDKSYRPPTLQWQHAAARVVDECEANLWANNPKAQRVRDYLARRGLQPLTLRQWRVGYNPKSMEIAGLWVWAGITLPAFMGCDLWGIKIRLLPEHPYRCVACGEHLTMTGPCPKCGKRNKYRQVKGSEPALYGVHTLADRRVVFACEGEFDCMLAYQEGKLLGGVFTTTNGAGKDWQPEWTSYLLDAERIITLYDNDAAGERGADKLNTLPLGGRVFTARVPAGKDVTDYHFRGGNVYQWMRAARWEALSSLFADDAAHAAYIRSRLEHVQPPHQLAIDLLGDLDELEGT